MECMLNRQIVQENSGGSGDYSETWVWNRQIDTKTKFSYSVNFVNNGETYNNLSVAGSKEPGLSGFSYAFYYGSVNVITASGDGTFPETQQSYRKITFLEPPTGDLLTYLQANAVKQASDTAVQTNKSIAITSNGTTTITPDAPYDAMSKVDLTVNAAGGGETSTVTLLREPIDQWGSTGGRITYVDGNGQLQNYSWTGRPSKDIVFTCLRNSLVYITGAVGFYGDGAGSLSEVLDMNAPLDIYFVANTTAILTPYDGS